jgi:hypothetical protein
LRRHLAIWQIRYRFGTALSPIPTRLSFGQCAYAFATLQCLCLGLCYNCERDPYPRPWFEKITRRWVPHGLSNRQKVKRIEASTELVQPLTELEADSFDGIITGDES